MRSVELRRDVTPEGRAVAVKTGPVSLSFTSEAAGLRWLGDIAAEVIEVGEDRLVLEWISTTGPGTGRRRAVRPRAAQSMRRGARRAACPHPWRLAYREVAPLADGWRERVTLHQLHPLAVHAVLYGEPYRRALLEAAGVRG